MGLDLILGRNVDRRLVKFKSLCDKDLRFNNVDTRHLLGHGMFDLNTGVDFDEEKITSVCVNQKLNRSRSDIISTFHQSNGRFADVLAELSGQAPGRGNFDHLLMSTLDRAITFPKVDQVPMFITDDLNFDVFSTFDVSFDKDFRTTKGSAGFALGFLQFALQVLGFFDDAHPSSPPRRSWL